MGKKDYIGPTIKKGKAAVVPEGPVAKLSTKASKGMLAAKKSMGEEDGPVDGVAVKAPLQMGPPVKLPPNLKNKITEAAKAVESKKKTEATVEPNVMLGNSHISSISNLLANDRMAKPIITAWKDDSPDPKSGL